ncbi:hypothetical protein K437DRAFT_266148 [Tilletiaria anomala UBC 951]|uniref:Uncharacterized protein n=1 Tax=Tilletiaria anomala (strain ATCC 24038 / CBS 436.72 / UBC 951) TaxID=1037660 RepID=A0A066WPM7_TILAU|nr:uncharacterized protein K437DRAFT_266148 [Tilletiaria anomala UBC 951]KDN52944.1 hypothetical protein K437DRAFT_266148 [Tilletiaria anomala UBC 951]
MSQISSNAAGLSSRAASSRRRRSNGSNRTREYAAANPTQGFPEDNPQVYELYWPKSQVDARSSYVANKHVWRGIKGAAIPQGELGLHHASAILSPETPRWRRLLQASNWVFDTENSDFIGCSLGHDSKLPDPTHHHLPLSSTMTSTPSVELGGMVLWRCDLVHSGESVHTGASDASVIYIPAIPPLTLPNMCYIIQDRCGHFTRDKTSARLFPVSAGKCEFVGRGTPTDVKKEKEAFESLQRCGVCVVRSCRPPYPL